MRQLGDKVILKGVYFEEYNNKEFTIINVHITEEKAVLYRVFNDGFDPIWVTEENFA